MFTVMHHTGPIKCPIKKCPFSDTEGAEISAQVKTVAEHAFKELVERAAACDRIRGVLALLKRYESLFRLPTRIRQASERGLYDQARPRMLIFTS